MEAKQSMVLHLSKIGKVRALPHAWKVVIFPVVSTSLLSPALRLSPLSPALHRQCYGQNQYSQEKKKERRRHIFSPLLYELYEENCLWERQKCHGADKRKIGWERYEKKRKSENDGAGLCKAESNGDGSNQGGDKMG